MLRLKQVCSWFDGGFSNWEGLGLTSEDGVTGDPTAGLGSMFNDPQLFQKLAQNPKTSKFLADPTFMAKLSQMQNNPSGSQDIFSDPRMIQVLVFLWVWIWI